MVTNVFNANIAQTIEQQFIAAKAVQAVTYISVRFSTINKDDPTGPSIVDLNEILVPPFTAWAIVTEKISKYSDSSRRESFVDNVVGIEGALIELCGYTVYFVKRVTPKINDIIEVGGKKYFVQLAEPDPAGAMYRCQCTFPAQKPVVIPVMNPPVPP